MVKWIVINKINRTPYAPIVDVQGITRFLIDWKATEIFKQNDCDAFGAGLSGEIPYAYARKRCDPKNDPGPPQSSENQNKQFNDAVKEK